MASTMEPCWMCPASNQCIKVQPTSFINTSAWNDASDVLDMPELCHPATSTVPKAPTPYDALDGAVLSAASLPKTEQLANNRIAVLSSHVRPS